MWVVEERQAMGLTIYYHLKSRIKHVSSAKARLEELRQFALGLPFEEVDDIAEFEGEEACDYENHRDSDTAWMLVDVAAYVQYQDRHGRRFGGHVKPNHVISFSAWPGEGCEEANFGLCHYPESFVTHDGRVLSTDLNGWSWHSFCKTQFASDPRCGGVKNFLKCHLTVIRLLDFAKELKILEKVKDDGGFWQKRDVAELAREIGRWNRMLAGIMGELKDEFGAGFVSPIMEYSLFEHLEADARAVNG